MSGLIQGGGRSWSAVVLRSRGSKCGFEAAPDGLFGLGLRPCTGNGKTTGFLWGNFADGAGGGVAVGMGVNDQPQVLGGLSGSQEETEGRVALGSRVTQRLPGLWGWAQDEFK